VTCLVLVSVVNMARGDEPQINGVLQAVAKLDMEYNSNLFYLPSDADTEADLGTSKRSTFIFTEQAGLKIDKTWSLQHFVFEVDGVHQSFQSFHFLDYSAVNYNGKWDWQLGKRLTGTVTAYRQEDLGSYADFQEYNVQNLQTVTSEHLDVDYWAIGNWHLVGGIGRYVVDNPGQFTQVGSFAENTTSAGVKYVNSAGNQITATFINAVGTFDRAPDPVQLLDSHYLQREGKVTVDFSPTGHLAAQVWAGYVDRHDRQLGERDFDGFVGGASATWTATEKTQVKLSFVHDLIDYEDDQSSYYLTNVVRLSPVWNATPKVSVTLDLDYAFNNFRQPVQPVADLRQDKLWDADLKIQYRATRNVTLTAYVETGRRVSNVDSYSYRDNVAGLTANFAF
jgi:exopolysaccharide biosynthesis operon protein EpsL